MIAVASGVRRHAAPIRAPAEDIDDMQTMTIYDGSDALTIEIVGAPADEPVPLRRELGNYWRYVHVTRKPWFYSVLVGRHDVDQMVWHQRSDVSTHQVVRNAVATRWYGKKERDPSSDRGAADPCKSTPPERVWPPLSTPSPDRERTFAGAFLIELAQDPRTKRRRNDHVTPILPQRCSHFGELLQQRSALGTGLVVALDVHARQRIKFAVEIRLDTQCFSAQHAGLLRPR